MDTSAKRPVDSIIEEIFLNAKNQIQIGAPGYKNFDYVRETDNALHLKRESGNETKISRKTLKKAIEAVRCDHSIYCKGPNALRKAAGIKFVTSPTWALLRSVTLNSLVK